MQVSLPKTVEMFCGMCEKVGTNFFHRPTTNFSLFEQEKIEQSLQQNY